MGRNSNVLLYLKVRLRFKYRYSIVSSNPKRLKRIWVSVIGFDQKEVIGELRESNLFGMVRENQISRELMRT